MPTIANERKSEDVYDSAIGQSRALLVWSRIIMPDGSSIQIDNLPAPPTPLVMPVWKTKWIIIAGGF